MIRALLALLLALAAGTPPAMAHDSQPLLIQIDEQSPQVYRVRAKLPPSMATHAPPVVTLGPGCESRSGEAPAGTAASIASLFSCKQPLKGGKVAIDFPDYNPSLAIVFRFQPLDGQLMSSLQPPDELEWQVPGGEESAVAWGETLLRYGQLGVEHILFGFDHLLFVLCLLLIAGNTRRTIQVVTGFTIAHSVTLALAALGVIRPPTVLIEALIALSIVMLAVEIARRDRSTIVWRYPMAISMIFGLLHGFGFAAALGEIGLPGNQELVALLSFNVGVELGQITFVLAVVAIFVLLEKLWPRLRNSGAAAPALLATPIAYVVGSLASYWLFERVALF